MKPFFFAAMIKVVAQLVIIRHAQAEGNARGILMGSSKTMNSHLSQDGRAAARAKAKELQTASFLPDKIFCSKLNRTKETAAIIKEELGSSVAIEELVQLNERSFGQYEGKPHQDVIDAFDKYGKNPPSVELVTAFVERVLQGFEIIKQQNSGSALVVTHSNPLAVIRCALYHPSKLQEFWEFEDDSYLEGLIYKY